MAEPISFVKAVQEYFSANPHGKKVEISEFKELSRQDKVELREMLIGHGFNVSELPEPKPVAE